MATTQNTTRYGVDQAVQELVKAGKLMRIIPNNGKANHFYISDIYENEKEEKSMMTLDTIMANMPLVEREIIMDKMVKASRDILETIADMGYIDEYETSLTAMEERGYQDELGEIKQQIGICKGGLTMKKIGLGIAILLFAIILSLCSSGMGLLVIGIGIVGLIFSIIGFMERK